MGDPYGRRMYHRPPRQEWITSQPQYYGSNAIDPFGMTGGGYMGPGMVRAGNIGPPMLPSAFQHQAPFTLPPPGTTPTSNMAFTPADLGSRGTIITSQSPQINPYTNHQGLPILPPMPG